MQRAHDGRNIESLCTQFGVEPSDAYLPISGGFGLNCPTNTYLLDRFDFKGLTPPCANDAGQALGIGLLGLHNLGLLDRSGFRLNSAYYGCELNDVDKSIDYYAEWISEVSDFSPEQLIEDIIEMPIAWVAGAAELGPRALGHRSLLGDPRSPETKAVLNRVKGRQWRRPVTPLVLEDRAAHWCVQNCPSPFMLEAVQVRPERRSRVPVILHLDGSARHQTLERAVNPLLYDALAAFDRQVGVPIFCNTSLNKPFRTTNSTFSRQTHRISPPTWGQLGMWLMHQQLHSRSETLNLQLRASFPESVTPDSIVRAVTVLVRRHEALRTTFDETIEGRLRALTQGEGEFAVRIYRLTDSPLPTDDLVERVMGAERKHLFDLGKDVPVRLAVIELPSGACRVSLVVSHMAADGYSLGVLKRELEELVAGGPGTDAGPRDPGDDAVRLQSFEIAAAETSARGETENRVSLKYWHETLRHAPRTRFPWGRGTNGSKPEVRVVLNSRAVVLAAGELAARYGARMSGVGLAAISAVLSAVSGDTQVMYQVACSNRASEAIRASVGCIAQGGLFFVETETPRFSDLLARAGRAALMAYSSARYDSVLRNAVAAEAGLRCGVRFDLHTIVSDELSAARPPAGFPQRPGPASMNVALGETLIEYRSSESVASERFLLHLGNRDSIARLTVRADPETFTEQLVSTVLHGIESVLVGACRADRSPADLALDAGVRTPQERGADWVHTDMGWVDLSSVAEMVELHRASEGDVRSVRRGARSRGVPRCQAQPRQRGGAA
ncbi:carbamoyltransferase C-terminal domain-containing protein [Streptomyces sp. NPDC001401]|uniref:carbamoyltransferase C-terminal domain-containing protein n=1 Tax=Streptomyces sp. NPDC001401 TaxID=3364570 RepID=UPI0036CC41DB